MIISTWLFIVGGCLLGAIQLGAGVAVGLWLCRADKAAARSGRQEMQSASRIAQVLQSLAEEVSTSVGEHQVQIENASEALLSEPAAGGESLADLVVDVIGGIVRANHNLQAKLQTAESRLQEQAVEIETHLTRSLTDPLTGLPNRREFNERLQERMAGWNRRGEVFSLLMLDVDHFKPLNDRHGHLAGDMMLTMLGRVLRGVLRRDDAVARYGGEEFAMILPGTTLAQAAQVVPKVRDAIASVRANHAGAILHVTASGGLATIQIGETTESLIGRADSALYAAKSAGRDCAFLHDGTRCRPVLAAEMLPPAADARPASGAQHSSPPALDNISPELAQTCDELREFVQNRIAPTKDALSAR